MSTEPMKGLFKLHDTHGLSLTDSVMLALEKGINPDFYAFCLDALSAGIREAMIDNGLPREILSKVEVVLNHKFENK